MKKRRSKTYITRLGNEAAKYYFENPDTTLKALSEKFNISQTKISSVISKKLKQKFDNSFSRKHID